MTDIVPNAKTWKDRFKLSGLRKLWPFSRLSTIKWTAAPKHLALLFFGLCGELVAVILGVAILWFGSLNSLLARQTVNVAGLKPNAQMLFSQAFNGSDAEVGDMKVSWHPANNDIVFDAHDVVINDKDGQELKAVKRLQSKVPLAQAFKGIMRPSEITIDGGTVTWLRDSQGNIVAGLGMPDTVGRFGPVWRGRNPDADRKGLNMDGISRVVITNATAFIIDDKDELDITLRETDIDFEQSAEGLRLDLESSLEKDDQTNFLTLTLKASLDFKDYTIAMTADGVNPSLVLPRRGNYSRLKSLNSNVDLKSLIKVNLTIGLETADIEFNAGQGQVKLGKEDVNFDQLYATARLTPDSQIMDITRLGLSSDKLNFTGQGTLSELGALTDGNINSSPLFDITLADLQIDATPQLTELLDIKKLESRGRFDYDGRRLDLTALSVDFGDYEISGNGVFSQDEEGAWDLIKIKGGVTGFFDSARLLSIWPKNGLDGLRRWIDSAVISANIDNLNFDVNLPKIIFEGQSLGPENLNVTFDVKDTEIKYIQKMSPFEGIAGTGEILGNTATFIADKGRVGEIVASSARVEIPAIFPSGGDVNVTVNGDGTTQDFVRLIDEEPLRFATRYGVDPQDFSGTGQVEAKITVPLRVVFDSKLLRYDINGEFKDASAPFSLGKYKINSGDVSVTADRNSMLISGPANIGAWRANLEWREIFDDGETPAQYRVSGDLTRDDLDSFGLGFREYFDGTIRLDIDATGDGTQVASANILADLSGTDIFLGQQWSKARGVAGSFMGQLIRSAQGGITFNNITMTAPGLDVGGRLAFEENFKLIELDLNRARIDGFIDAALQVKPDLASEKLSIFASGRHLDVSTYVAQGISTRTSSEQVPVLLTATVENLTLAENYQLENAKILYGHNGVGITDARLNGETPDGAMTVEMVTGVKDDPESLNRQINITIPDASKAAFAFLGLDNISGGNMTATAEIPPLNSEGAMIGTVIVEDFVLEDAPILAKMLSLASLTGLFDALDGKGLHFDNLTIPFSLRGKRLSLRGARMSGPAMGITTAGDILFDEQVLDLDGTLVPAYTANSILGDIPVLGDILVGKKGEGIIALSYDVDGPFDATLISVNPLSALTPGFLRGIFRKKRDKLPEEVMAEIESVAPK